jgi:hypothetical protein
MIGRFHELALASTEILSSVQFYEALGFVQTSTNDIWMHPYGVLTDGRIFLGLHQRRIASPALTFVLPDLASHVTSLEERGIVLSERHTGPDEFNRVSFAAPGGQMTMLIEARTYSPPPQDAVRATHCGRFDAFSVPERDFAAAGEFWALFGFTANADVERPYPSARLDRADFALELHNSRTLDAPMLIFTASDMQKRLQTLRAKGITPLAQLPRGLDPHANALLEAPEGTLLLLLSS